MKTISVWGKDFNFENEIKTKHMRKIYPLMNSSDWDEIGLMIEIWKILLIDFDQKKFEDFIDELPISETNKFMKEIWKIIEVSSKKK